MSIMTVIESVKLRCGIPASITVYDEEFRQLITSCIDDMVTAGVPAFVIPSAYTDAESDATQRAITAITLYVQAYRDSDRADTTLYIRLYRNILHKLMLEPTEEDE